MDVYYIYAYTYIGAVRLLGVKLRTSSKAYQLQKAA